MSVAVLPSSPVAYGQPPALSYPNIAANVAPTSNSPSKKPKLSLNTTNLTPQLRKGATSLRLDTLSATSPTARNTFQNAYSPSQQQRSHSNDNKSYLSSSRPYQQSPATLSPLNTTGNNSISEYSRPGSSSSFSSTATPESSSSSIDSIASSATSLTSTSTLDSLVNECPYKAPTIRSILRNSPLPPSSASPATTSSPPKNLTLSTNESSTTTSPRPSSAQKRKLSLSGPSLCIEPQYKKTTKKVSFRLPLTEDIVTVRFTLRHSDIALATAAAAAAVAASADDSAESNADADSSSSRSKAQTKTSRLDQKFARLVEVQEDEAAAFASRHQRRRGSSDDEEEEDENVDGETGNGAEQTTEEREREGEMMCPATPVAGRAKRVLQWRWTIEDGDDACDRTGAGSVKPNTS